MVVRVLVVDDSSFFRRRITETLAADPAIEVIGGAPDGKEAVRMVREQRPDVVTMDIEMPVMDGITAVKQIMASCPTPVIMFSSLTHEGARATLDALEAGAMDFMPKRFEDIAKNREEGSREFCKRVKAVAGQKRNGVAKPGIAYSGATASTLTNRREASPVVSASSVSRVNGCQLVAIGSSTGGPMALQKVLVGLPANFSVPVVVVQHMPGTFTPAFAERLNNLCKIEVREAADGDVLKPGTAYIAPGGKQMLVRKGGHGGVVKIIDGEQSLNYKPCVDVTFRSISGCYTGNVLVVMLTGMGADGCEGTRQLKTGGARVWAQDEESSVVYGMPMAVVNAGLADRVMALNDIAVRLGQSI